MVDKESKEMLYHNTAMDNLLGDIPQLMRMFFYKMVIHQAYSALSTIGSETGGMKQEHVEIYNDILKLDFEINELQVEIEREIIGLYVFTCMNQAREHNPTFEGAMGQYIDVLKQEDHTIIPKYLEILGEFYQADKGHYYEIDYEKSMITNLYNWKKDAEMKLYQELGTKVDIVKVLEWLKNRNGSNILEVDRTRNYEVQNPFMNDILDSFKLDNLILSVIEDENHQLVGIVGMSNRKNKDVNFRFLRVISKLIEVNLNHVNLKDTLQQIQEVDLLTGFYTRSQYLQKLEELDRKPVKQLGVIFAHINDLNQLNMEWGFARGDANVKHAACVLQKYFPIEFYRISGNKFVGFYTEIDRETFDSEVFEFQNYLMQSDEQTFTVGHAWAQNRYKLLKLINNAERLMYVNKQKHYRVDTSDIKVSSMLLQELLTHLQRKEFEIYLQPQVYLDDTSLHGAEALIRLFDRENQEIIPPDQFIPQYEKSLIIRHIDFFVIETVCELLSQWMVIDKEIPISVNLSRITLLEHGIVDTISEICDKYRVPHRLLVIEITEQMDLIEIGALSSLVKQLQGKGFKTSLDDFGCAYSNIVTLAQVEVDEVKIDKSLMDRVIVDKKNEVIVKNILEMCQELNGIETLAEGIETQEQADLLVKYRCLLGQGYLYSPPIPIEQFYSKYIA